jgi:beta-glucosidase
MVSFALPSVRADCPGLQSQGVGACLKHLVCNERETRRKQYNVKVSSATLREVYLRPFEQIIHAAKPYCIMAAYNDIVRKGPPLSLTAERRPLLAQHRSTRHCSKRLSLRRAHHERLVWHKVRTRSIALVLTRRDGVASLKAGVDLEMPFPVTRGGRLVQAVRSGLVPIGHVDQAVRRVVDTAAKTPGKRDEERPFDNDPRRIALCRRVGADGMVLLRNTNHVLPLRPDADILVVGQHATRPSVGGGGSAMLNPPYVVTPLEAIRQAATGKVTHHPGVPAWRLVPELDSDLCGTVKINLRNVGSDQVVWSSEREKAAISLLDQRIAALGPDFTLDLETTIHPRQTGRHLLSVFCVAETEVYLGDRLVETIHPPHISVEQFLFERFDFETILPVDLTRDVPVTLRVTSKSKPKTGMEPPPQGLRIGLVYDVDVSESIRQAEDLARSASQVVVVTGLDSDWEGEGSDRANIDLPGHQGELVRRLAAVNPNVVLVNQSGGPVDLRCADRVSGIVQAFYGGMECGNGELGLGVITDGSAIADVLFGTVNPSGRLAMTFPKTLEECPTYEAFHNDSDGLVYEEGSLFGYRSYLHRQIQPAYRKSRSIDSC